MARYVHDEHVADAPSRPQAGLALHYLRQHLVGVQASLHEQIGFPGANELDRLLGGGVAVGCVDDLDLVKIERVLLGNTSDLGLWANEDRLDQSCLGRLDNAFEGGLVARMRHSGRNGLELLCCGDETIVLFMTTRRGGGCVFVHGSVLLESTPAKHGSAQIARMWPTRLCRSRRLRRAGGRRTILLRPAILWNAGLLSCPKHCLHLRESSLAQLAFYAEHFNHLA